MSGAGRRIMAKKPKTVWVCQECGSESPKWIGRCSVCGAFGTMVEERIPDTSDSDTRRRISSSGGGGRPSRLNRVGSADRERIGTGIGELDLVLGGGLVRGSLTLISGEPGIGKSTLILQTAANIAAGGKNVLYVSGEESEEQIKMRADRICREVPDTLFVMAETNMENIAAVCETMHPAFLIIDSIQTMYTDTLESAPGSVSQVRSCGNLLMKLGKTDSIPVFIVAHVTKSGELAGPKIVEHLVDTVLNFTGERDHEIRILRAYKNRFGTTSEIGAFSMEPEGLREISDLSGRFLENTEEMTEGAVIGGLYEGSRSVLLEIQALTAHSNGGFPRRTAVGMDHQRLSMIIAVLEKRLGVRLMNEDVFVNIVGGLRPDSTSVDLAAAIAVCSSLEGIVPPVRTVCIGEVGLTGDLRSVRSAEKIASEAAKLGYRKVIMPAKNAESMKNVKLPGHCTVAGARNIRDALSAYRE